MITQPLLNFDAPAPRRRRPNLTDQLAEYLSARVGMFVPVVDMARIAGTSGVRQRRLECEQRGIRLQHPGEYRDGLYGFVVLAAGEGQKGRAA